MNVLGFGLGGELIQKNPKEPWLTPPLAYPA